MEEHRTFNIKIADLTVQMHSRFDYSEKKCADYIVNSETVDLVAVADRNRMSHEAKNSKVIFPQGYSEYIDLFRSIAEQLPEFDRFVFHGASIKAFEKGYVFTAPSGTGKSTHVGLLMKYFGDRVSIINGDKPLLGVSGNLATVYSCPWAGKEGWNNNTSAPLGGIILLRRGTVNTIKKIDPAEYFNELMKQVYIPDGSVMKLKTLELIDRLSKLVPFYLLECDMSEKAAQTSFNMMLENAEFK